MVAPLVAAAGISAAGSLLGGLFGGGGAAKAAKAQLKATREQIAATERNRDYQYNLNAPTIANSDRATDLFAGFVGAGDNPAAAQGALDTFRESSGYQDLVKEGLSAVNANAYAKGAGRSGATYKALQDRGTSIADRSAQGWMGNLGTLMNLGGQARGLVAGVGTNSVNATNAATQAGADASSNAALAQGQNWAQALQGIGLAASQAYGSSYGNGGAATTSPWTLPPATTTPPYYPGYGLNAGRA